MKDRKQQDMEDKERIHSPDHHATCDPADPVFRIRKKRQVLGDFCLGSC